MRTLGLLLASAVLFSASLRLRASELGACGNGRDIQTIVASSTSGAVVGQGLGRGVVVYAHGLSAPDDKLIQMPYGAFLLADPKGERFALLEGSNIHLYSFSDFRRLAKSSSRVLKGQSILAWRWIRDSDEAVLFTELAKSDMLGLKTTRATSLIRVNLSNGTGTQRALEIGGDYLSAVFDSAGDRLAIGFKDGRVEVISSSDGKPLTSYRGHGALWTSLGLAFHPARNVLASSDGSRLILYDLERKQTQAVHQTQDGVALLEFIADGQYLIAADASNLSLLDLQGRRLETQHYDETRSSFFVVESLKRVFTAGSDLVCWRTFERWKKAPSVAAGGPGPAPGPTGSPRELPAASTEVVYKGKPLSHYVRQLNDKDFTTRLFAFGTIGEIGPSAAAAVPALMDVLDGKEPARKPNEPSLKGHAIRALVAIGPAAAPAVSKIAEALKSEDPDLRSLAAKAFVTFGPSAAEAVPALIEALKDPVPDIRGAAIQSLGAIGPGAKSAVPALKSIKKEKGQPEWIRGMADDALDKIQSR